MTQEAFIALWAVLMAAIALTANWSLSRADLKHGPGEDNRKRQHGWRVGTL